jgi:type IV pilus modification protein PilV
MTMKKQRGFSLVECMIALVIVSVGLLGSGALLGTAIRSGLGSKQLTTAKILAQDKFESLRNQGYASLSSGTDTVAQGGFTYQRNWTVATSGNTKKLIVEVAVDGRTVSAGMLRGE